MAKILLHGAGATNAGGYLHAGSSPEIGTRADQVHPDRADVYITTGRAIGRNAAPAADVALAKADDK